MKRKVKSSIDDLDIHTSPSLYCRLSPLVWTVPDIILSFKLLQLKANGIDVRIDLLSSIIVSMDLISGLCLI